MVFDVGEVYLEPARPQQWNAVAEFAFTNASSEQHARLHVRHKSCGCGVVEIERPQLAPGAKSRIRVGFSAPYARQERAESVRIATGLADYPDFVVTVKASLCPRLLLEMQGPPHVSVPWEGEARVRATTIAYQPAREPQRAFRLNVRGPGITARSLGQPRSALYGQMRKEWQEWEVTIAAQRGNGASDAVGTYQELVLEAAYGEWSIRNAIYWRVQPWIIAEPRELFFMAGSAERTQAALRLVADEPFAILGADAPEGLEIEPGRCCEQKEHTLVVRCVQPPGSAATSVKEIVLHTSHSRQPLVRVAVYTLALPK
jgi:hypothetical protein